MLLPLILLLLLLLGSVTTITSTVFPLKEDIYFKSTPKKIISLLFLYLNLSCLSIFVFLLCCLWEGSKFRVQLLSHTHTRDRNPNQYSYNSFTSLCFQERHWCILFVCILQLPLFALSQSFLYFLQLILLTLSYNNSRKT